ncbi:LOW QUALITY PROTEIN: quinone oxidoreductase-like protein 2 [Aegotheles albertisi]
MVALPPTHGTASLVLSHKAQLQLGLTWEGRIVGMNFAEGKIPSIPTNPLLLKNLSAMGSLSLYQEEDFPIYSSTISSIPQYFQEENTHPHVGTFFKLEKVETRFLNEAFNHVLQNKATGKVIISMK